jgi:hypothetical protein
MKTYYVEMEVSISVQVTEAEGTLEAFKKAKGLVSSLLGSEAVRNVGYNLNSVHRALNERRVENSDERR